MDQVLALDAYSADAKALIVAAQILADGRRHKCLSPVHVLSCAMADGRVADALRQGGVDPAKITRDVESLLEREPSAREQSHMSSATLSLLKRAEKNATGPVTVADVLRALAEEKGGLGELLEPRAKDGGRLFEPVSSILSSASVPASAPFRLERFAADAKAILNAAQILADERSHKYMSPVHLLSRAMVEGRVASALRKVGVDPAKITRDVESLLEREPSAQERSYMSSATLSLLKRVEKNAQGVVTVADVLRALAEEKGGLGELLEPFVAAGGSFLALLSSRSPASPTEMPARAAVSSPAIMSLPSRVTPELGRLFGRLKSVSGEATAPTDEDLQVATCVKNAPDDYLAYLKHFGGEPTQLGLWHVAAVKELDRVGAEFREWGGKDPLVPFAQDGSDFVAFDFSAAPPTIVYCVHSASPEVLPGTFTEWLASQLAEVAQLEEEEREYQDDVKAWTTSYAPFHRTRFGALAIPLIRDEAGRNLRNVLLDLHLQRTLHPYTVRAGALLYAGLLHFAESSIGCWLCGAMTEWLGSTEPAARCTACKEPLLLLTWAQHRKLKARGVNAPCFGDWAAEFASLTQPVFTTIDSPGQKPAPRWARHVAFGGERDPCVLPGDWKQY